MKKLSLFFVTILFSIIMLSQEDPVKWTISNPEINNNTYTLTISADIDKDWYIYGMNMDEGGPLPLIIDIDNAEKYIQTYKIHEISTPVNTFDEIFNMTVSSHSGNVEFSCSFIPNPEIPTINLIIDGQACNKKDGSCLPIYESFSVKIK